MGASGGLPSAPVLRSGQRGIYHFIRLLQHSSVALGLHGESFDPEGATPSDLRAAAVGLWERYSPVAAHPAFSPFGTESGLILCQGADHVAYLLCHLRADGILHPKGVKDNSAAQLWFGSDFALRLRRQLLDRTFNAQRAAALLPSLDVPTNLANSVSAHPLPALQGAGGVAAALFERVERA